jgi:D-xylose transport system substrate-binding protein
VDAVLASNDGTASGAISALEDKKLAGQVPVSGQDADLIACQYIWKGIQTVTVYKPIRALAEYAAIAAVTAAKMAVSAAKMSDTLSQANFFDSTAVNIANGPFQVPAVFLTPIPVTKENLMETVVADGYHSREEITGPVAAGP